MEFTSILWRSWWALINVSLTIFHVFFRIGNTSTYYHHTRKMVSVLGNQGVVCSVWWITEEFVHRNFLSRGVWRRRKSCSRRSVSSDDDSCDGRRRKPGQPRELLVTGDTLVMGLAKSKFQSISIGYGIDLKPWNGNLNWEFFQNSPLCWMVWLHERS